MNVRIANSNAKKPSVGRKVDVGMSYYLHANEELQAGIRRIAQSELDKSIREIDDRELARHKTVHQVRKRCKKLRGLLRLVRPAMEKVYKAENKALRDAARNLSDVRDAKSIILTYDNVMHRFADQVNQQSFESIRRELTVRLSAIKDTLVDERLFVIRQQLVAVKSRVNDWSFDDQTFEPAREGLTKNRQEAVKALREAKKNPTTNQLHELRKRVKYHGYHLQILSGLWPVAIRPLISEFGHLGDELGNDHDLAVFGKTVCQSPDLFGIPDDVRVLEGLIVQHRKLLQKACFNRASYLFAEETEAFTLRLESYWKLWSNCSD